MTARPDGPAAAISGPVTGGKGIALLSTNPLRSSFRESEYFASGKATSYTAKATPASGAWSLTPGKTAAYRTRIVARLPKDPKSFNGTVVVEWFNVSAGADSDPDFTYSAAELLRRGYAYVGVSAQQAGVSGATEGDIASQLLPGQGKSGLRNVDPARYGSLEHPGDAYSFDIFTQVARALRNPGPVDALGGLRPLHVIATGESQSAFTLTTYVDGVQPLTHEFDGFFIHSRGAGAAPLDGGNSGQSFVSGGVRIRTDTDVPVLIFETETDIALLRYDLAEQPDSEHIRVWEVAGTAHADATVVGAAASLLGCGEQINSGPQQYVERAALNALERWVLTGTAPASAPRLEHDGATLKRNALGIALGGIRTPPVDVPFAVQSGEPAGSSKAICQLFGHSTPFSAQQLQQLYGSKAEFLRKYAAAASRSVDAGYVLPADRSAVIAEAQQVSFA